MLSVADIFSRWTRDLPKSADHTKRIALINNLKQRSITDAAAGFHSTAKTEFDKIWNSIKILVNREIDREVSRMRIPDDERTTAQIGTIRFYTGLAN